MLYEWNPEAEKLGEAIIAEHHPHLAKTKIAYLFKMVPEPKPGRKPTRAGKKKVWGKAGLVPAKYAELLEANYKFVIEFDSWVWSMLTFAQRKALVDHELCHCGNDADGPYMKHHDVEEFRDVINRHGFWKDDVRLFAESCAPLFENAEKPNGKTVLAETVRQLKTEQALTKGTPKKADENTLTFEVPGEEPVTMTDSEFKAAVKKITGRRGVAGRPRRQPRV